MSNNQRSDKSDNVMQSFFYFWPIFKTTNWCKTSPQTNCNFERCCEKSLLLFLFQIWHFSHRMWEFLRIECWNWWNYTDLLHQIMKSLELVTIKLFTYLYQNDRWDTRGRILTWLSFDQFQWQLTPLGLLHKTIWIPHQELRYLNDKNKSSS